MSIDDRFWDRDALYEEVWSTPMKTLAQKYGISDVGLAKICRKLTIPLPGRGYWARKEAGQELKREPLPALREKMVLRKPDPRPEPPKLSDLATEPEVKLIEKLDKTGELPLRHGSLSHELIIQARAAFRDAGVDDRKILRCRGSCLDLRVSENSLDRSFRIMAGLISIIEDSGFKVSVTKGDRNHTTAMVLGQEVRFGLVEKVERVEIVAPSKGGLLERVLTFAGKPVTFEPSGVLSIQVWNGWGSNRSSWKDQKDKRLEAQLSQVAAGFIRLALADRRNAEERRAAERERERIAEEDARLQASIKSEGRKVNALRNAASRWYRAEQIRSFISAARDAAVVNGEATEPGTPFGDWIEWAESQADRLDPLKVSPPSILDHKPEPTPPYPYYGYQKPDPPFRLPKPIWKMK
jgi:hypothetical protein